MGLQFRDLVVKKEISLTDLKGKILVVDGYNNLYQYLTTIRSPDGAVFTDSQGRVTSHLIGLFYRTTTLLEEGLRLAFVFDGKPPAIKQKTWEKRSAAKAEAVKRFREAEKMGAKEEMKRYASRSAILTKEMVADAKTVLAALGLPVVQAPSEGEAQTTHMVKRGDAYASISQDYDNLIFGCPRLVRNLSVAGKRKKAGTLGYQTVKPELILLDDVLKHVRLNLEQLQVLAMLIGTDYNPGGIKGIGPKTALKLLQEYGSDFEALFQKVNWPEQYPDMGWKSLLQAIQTIPVTDDYRLQWQVPDEKKLRTLLIEGYGFAAERVEQRLKSLREHGKMVVQKGLGSYFL
ncbi:flap endonuclease-1 [Candidatus Woesearchaeota archaeon]|nr:flap endonuclease-1 [Candidatus Woesearchaeota archaeon]